jgi:hypothetical protein
VEHTLSITAITNGPTTQTIAARVEAYERKRALPALSEDVIARSVLVENSLCSTCLLRPARAKKDPLHGPRYHAPSITTHPLSSVSAKKTDQ